MSQIDFVNLVPNYIARYFLEIVDHKYTKHRYHIGHHHYQVQVPVLILFHNNLIRLLIIIVAIFVAVLYLQITDTSERNHQQIQNNVCQHQDKQKHFDQVLILEVLLVRFGSQNIEQMF